MDSIQWAFSPYHIGLTFGKPGVVFHGLSTDALWSPATFVALSVLTTLASIALYRLTYHPLAKIPGPKPWAMTRIPYFYYLLTGQLVHRITKLHEQFGDAVRIAPNEVSYTDPSAWQQIHGYRPRIGQFPLNKVWLFKEEGKADSIMSADTEGHGRMRRVLSAAFTTPAIKTYEKVIHLYTDLLMQKFHERLTQGQHTVEIVHRLNGLMFDIIGELSFHRSFGSVENGRLHDWILLLFSYYKATCFVACARYIPFAEKTLIALIPKSLKEKQQEHSARTVESIRSRLTSNKNTSDYADFVDIFADGISKGRISLGEVETSMTIVLSGGSETTATCLSGTINYLIRYPEVLRKATNEVRSTFQDPKEMTFESLEPLPYLNAVIKEGLRLSPPVPCGIPRVVPDDGAVVCGTYLPAKTAVSVHQFATYRSPKYWAEPNAMVPERWLPQPPTSKYAGDIHAALKPFSVGPRRCVGEQLAWAMMRLILSNFLWHFDLSEPLSDGTPMRRWENQKTYALWTREPFEIRMDARKTS